MDVREETGLSIWVLLNYGHFSSLALFLSLFNSKDGENADLKKAVQVGGPSILGCRIELGNQRRKEKSPNSALGWHNPRAEHRPRPHSEQNSLCQEPWVISLVSLVLG